MKNGLKFTAESKLSTHLNGDFSIMVVENTETKKEHAVLIKGDVFEKSGVLCRVASECLPGMVFGYNGCECKEQFDQTVEMINKNGSGVIIFLRQEGRGHGLTTKIKALRNKNNGMDTFEAVEALGIDADIRDYWEAAEILKRLSIDSVRLITNNPSKKKRLEELGVSVEEMVSVEAESTPETEKHLKAKKARGHTLSLK